MIDFDGVRWEPATASESLAALAVARGVLLDTYREDPEALGLGRAPCVYFHDAGTPDPPAGVDIVISSQDTDGRTGWLCGLPYCCLRPGYWGKPAVPISERVERVLVTTGAMDPGGASEALVAATRSALPGTDVRRVRGPYASSLGAADVAEVEAPDDLRPLLEEVDLVLCLGGQTALESASLGVPTVAVALVENQRANVARLAAVGAVVAAKLDGGLASALSALASDHRRRIELSRTAYAAVDGFGALRVAAVIERLLQAA